MLRINNIPIEDLKQSDIVQFSGKEWYVIGTDGKEEVSLLAKDCWRDMEFGENNNYFKSPIRKYLRKFANEDMIQQIILTAEGEIEEKLFLLGYDEVIYLPKKIKEYKERPVGWWLRSPLRSTTHPVWHVSPSGSFVDYYYAYYTYGIRPACVVNVQALKEAGNE